jgi:hypothetical protein
MLEGAVRAHAITLTEDLDFDGLALAQGSHARRKQGLRSRLRAMHDAGMIVPHFAHLRLDDADALATDDERQANYAGMRDRLARRDQSI